MAERWHGRGFTKAFDSLLDDPRLKAVNAHAFRLFMHALKIARQADAGGTTGPVSARGVEVSAGVDPGNGAVGWGLLGGVGLASLPLGRGGPVTINAGIFSGVVEQRGGKREQNVGKLEVRSKKEERSNSKPSTTPPKPAASAGVHTLVAYLYDKIKAHEKLDKLASFAGGHAGTTFATVLRAGYGEDAAKAAVDKWLASTPATTSVAAFAAQINRLLGPRPVREWAAKIKTGGLGTDEDEKRGKPGAYVTGRFPVNTTPFRSLALNDPKRFDREDVKP